MRVLLDNILIRRDEAQDKIGNIYVADTAKEAPAEGTVLGIGPKVESNLSVGDAVVFGKYAGIEVTVSGETLLILREKDVLGVREENNGQGN